MKTIKRFFILSFSLLLLVACGDDDKNSETDIVEVESVVQEGYSVDEVPNVYLTNPNNYVSDPDNLLSEEDKLYLNQLLRYFEDSLQIQCATIVLSAIDDEPNAFAHNLLNKWGVGDKSTDKGLVILLVTEDGSHGDVYMATGYGLEAELTDAVCKYVQVGTMVPLFMEGKLGEGLIEGVLHIRQMFTGEEAIYKRKQLVAQNKFILYSVDELLNLLIENNTTPVIDPDYAIDFTEEQKLSDMMQTFTDSTGIETKLIILSQDLDRYPENFVQDFFSAVKTNYKQSDSLILFLVGDIYCKPNLMLGKKWQEKLTPEECDYVLMDVSSIYTLDKGIEGILKVISNESALAALKEEVREMSEFEDNVVTLFGLFCTLFYVGYFWVVGKLKIRKYKKEDSNKYRAYITTFYKNRYKGYGCLLLLILPLTIIFFPILIVYLIVLARKKKKFIKQDLVCEQCGLHTIKTPKSKILQKPTYTSKGKKAYYFECKNCLYVHTEVFSIPKQTPPSSGGSSSSSGSSSWGSSSSGGGSWGGGSSGGGGAGTSW